MAQTLKYVVFRTKLGFSGLTATKKGIVRSQLPLPNAEKLKRDILINFETAKYDKNLFKEVQQQITAYFEGVHVDFDRNLPLVFDQCSEFKCSVLNACRKIRFGQTISYGRLAEKAGHPNAARAVGSVMSDNPVPLIIPCHRVLAAGGRIGGFSAEGGITLKKKMLDLEKA